MAELTRLSNGVTVAIDPMAGAQSASIGLYAAVGSRSEPDGQGGLAHLVEHMVFKGAGGRDARAIAEAIEDVGGSLNAWTARDQTVFHARTLGPDVGLGLELIADLVAQWREGYDVVYAQRRSRKGETMVKRIVSNVGGDCGRWRATRPRSWRSNCWRRRKEWSFTRP